MRDEGVTKYVCHWHESGPITDSGLSHLMEVRDELYGLSWIGEYPDGIGFGNVSYRLMDNSFVISGTQTGKVEKTTPDHYGRVISWNLVRNTLTCEGPIQASSEGMTHGVIYALSCEIKAVIHIHNYRLWEQALKRFPYTPAEVPYGTPQMGEAVNHLYKTTDLPHTKIFAMAGHEDGIIAFGGSLIEALDTLKKTFL